jgi:hypothetical protein
MSSSAHVSPWPTTTARTTASAGTGTGTGSRRASRGPGFPSSS